MRIDVQAMYHVAIILVTLSTLAGCSILPFGSRAGSEASVVVMTTNKGMVIIELHAETAPETAKNFEKLIKKKFYDGLTFHRRVNDANLNIIQGGDPSGDGTGGPGYTIIDEYQKANQRPHGRGTIAMARTNEPNSAGSQFYICLKPQPFLDNQYTTFGQVIQGMDVVDLLRVGDVMQTVRLEAKSKYVTPE